MSRMAEGKGGQEKERKKRERNCLWARGARRGCRIRRGALPVRTWRPCVCVVWRRPGSPPRRLHSLVHASLSRTRAARNAAAPSERPSETDQPARTPSLQWSHLFILFSPPFLDKKKQCLSILIIYIHSIYMTLKYTNTYIFNLIR